MAGLNDGLVAYYPFNGNANDETGNGKNGTVNGATLTQDRFGTTNTAYSFDGVDDKISIPVGIDAAIPETTISVWALTRTIFNPADPYGKDYRILIQTGTDADTFGGAMVLNIENGFIKYGVKLLNYNNWFSVADADKIIPNQWYNIVGKYYRGNKIEIWVNGQLKNSTTIPEVNLYNSAYHYSAIGAMGFIGSDQNFWDGIIDEVRIYNRALSATEIQELYNQSGQSHDHSPATPILSFPTDHAVEIDPNNINFQWQPCTDPDGDPVEYFICVREFGPDDNNVVQSYVVNNNYSVTLQPNKIYDWAVWAKDAYGNYSQMSEHKVFTTKIDENKSLAKFSGLGYDVDFFSYESIYSIVKNCIQYDDYTYKKYGIKFWKSPWMLTYPWYELKINIDANARNEIQEIAFRDQ